MLEIPQELAGRLDTDALRGVTSEDRITLPARFAALFSRKYTALTLTNLLTERVALSPTSPL